MSWLRSGAPRPATDLELRHRHRAEDRIRCTKDTGLSNLPLHDFWCAIVALACELTAWMQMLALTGHQARRWEPKRLRLRVFSIAGANHPFRTANPAGPGRPQPLGTAGHLRYPRPAPLARARSGVAG